MEIEDLDTFDKTIDKMSEKEFDQLLIDIGWKSEDDREFSAERILSRLNKYSQ